MSKADLTKIKYAVIADKLYEVQHLSIFNMSLTAAYCDKNIEDVPAEGVLLLDDMDVGFKIVIENGQKIT